MTQWDPGPSEVEPLRRLFAHELERRLLDGVSVGPRDAVLELASGFGATCLHLANRVRPGGRTICSDLRPERVAAIRRLVAEAGVDDVDVRVIDMLRIDLPDAAVDGILCRWGFMFPLPVETAFAEAARVLRPGRLISLAVWGDLASNPWIRLVDEALIDAGLPVPLDRSAPGQMFSLADRGRLRGLLEGAGFEHVGIERVALGWGYGSFEAFWEEEALIAGPIEDYLLTLPPSDLERVRTRLRERLAPFEQGSSGYRVPGVSLVANASRAARAAGTSAYRPGCARPT